MGWAGTIVDKCLEPFAPQWSVRRQAARTMLASGAYDGARKDYTNKDWKARNQTPDGAAFQDLDTLIARCRDLRRNTWSGRAVWDAYRRLVVGRGITPHANAVDAAGNALDEWNEQADLLWNRWARTPRFCDAEKRTTLYDMQSQIVGKLVCDGEVFIRRIVRPGSSPSPVPLAIRRYGVNQLNTALSQFGGNDVRRGIEVDATNTPIAYHFLNVPRNDVGRRAATESTRIAADEIEHIFIQEEEGQSHGVPIMSPVMSKMRDLSEYDQWELYAARVQACIALIITREHGQMGGGALAGASGEDTTDAHGNPENIYQPGMKFHGKVGEKVEGLTPTRPSGLYDPYVMAQKRNVGAGTGLSYEALSRDVSQTNYSGQRQGMLEDQRSVRPIQQLLIDRFMVPNWTDFITTAVLNGRLNAPGFFEFPERWEQADYTPEGYPWIDPLKEAQAWEILLRLGLTTYQEIDGSRGHYWKQVLKQRSRELIYIDSLPAGDRIARIDDAAPAVPGETKPDDAEDAPPRRSSLNGKGALHGRITQSTESN